MYTVVKEHFLNTSLDRVWRFYSNPYNLIITTPPSVLTEVETEAAFQTHQGQEFNYRISILPAVSASVKIKVKGFEEKKLVAKEQIKGPYKHWEFEQKFVAFKDGVRVIEEIKYTPPFGILGKWLNPIFYKPYIKKLANYRAKKATSLLSK